MVQERQSQTCRSKPRDAVKLRVSWADVAATESFSPKLKAAVAKLSSSSHCDLQSKDMLSQSYHQVEPQTECSTSEVVRQSLVDLLGMSCDQRQRLLKGPHISIRIGSVAVPDIPKRVANGIAATGVFFANRKQERRHASQH